MTGGLDAPRDARDVTDPSGGSRPSIDWGGLQPRGLQDATEPVHDQTRLLEARLDPTDLPSTTDRRPADHTDLLTADDADRLMPDRADVAVADLHPDRLAPPSPAEVADLRRAWEADPRPEAWIDRINPAWMGDAVEGRPGHTENCADCARAVQATLDGRPTAAGAIDAEGLPLRDHPADGGEHPAYTEQWAGRHAEVASYRDIGDRVADSRGSAIVFAQGDGGHAFNAIWSPERGRTMWADGQTGEVGDWPPAHLQERMPDSRAIFFRDARRTR